MLPRDLTHRRIRMRSRRQFVPGAAFALLAPALLGLAFLVSAEPVEAQSHRSAVTLLGGMSDNSDLTSGLDFVTQLESGWVAGIQAERWLGGGRAGLRLNGLFAQRLLEGEPGDYNVYALDLDLLLRALAPRPDRFAAPYIALGIGATRFASVAGSPTFARGAFGSDPVHRAHVFAGLGMDVPATGRLGLRLEVADQIVLPTVGKSPEASGFPVAHNLVVMGGLQLRLGMTGEPVAALPPVATPDDRRPAPPTVAVGPVLYTAQPFTFIEAATADRWVDLLRQRGLPVWTLDSVIQGQRVRRIRIGALPSEAEARSLATALERDYGWSIRVERIDADEPVPANAVARTGQFLDRR
jgi:hypothetical protein